MSTNKPADVKISELSIENEALKEQVTALKTRNDELEQALKKANDVIEGDVKAGLAQRIMTNSKYTIEDLSRMSIDELKATEKVLGMSNAPFKGIRPGFGVAGQDSPNLTVPNKFAFGKKGD